jgi:hypothetical protein
VKLPNFEQALIEREKIVDYLLNAVHPDNGGKAAFFEASGFTLQNWQLLANAFGKLAADGVVVKSMETSHGIKYIVEGRIETPQGKVIWA